MEGIRKEKVLKDRGKGSARRSHMHCVSPSLSSACLAGYKITPWGSPFTVLRRCATGSSRLFSFRAQDKRAIKGPPCPKKGDNSSRVKVAKGITSWLAHPRIAHSGTRLSNNSNKTQQSSCIDPYCFSRTSPMPFRFIKKTFHLTDQFLPNQIKPLKTSSAYNSFLTIPPGANHPP